MGTRTDADASALVETFAIDLAPLLAECAAGLIPDADVLALIPDLLRLRDLLGEPGLTGLCDALYPFLWRSARARPETLPRPLPSSPPR